MTNSNTQEATSMKKYREEIQAIMREEVAHNKEKLRLLHEQQKQHEIIEKIEEKINEQQINMTMKRAFANVSKAARSSVADVAESVAQDITYGTCCCYC